MNIIVLDKSNPEISKALEGCQVGQSKSIQVDVTPITNDGSVFVASVGSVSCEMEDESGPGDMAEDAAEQKPAMERPYKPSAKKM